MENKTINPEDIVQSLVLQIQDYAFRLANAEAMIKCEREENKKLKEQLMETKSKAK